MISNGIGMIPQKFAKGARVTIFEVPNPIEKIFVDWEEKNRCRISWKIVKNNEIFVRSEVEKFEIRIKSIQKNEKNRKRLEIF